ncbi:hypothetical protein AaE_004287 [Aphanomyces astaci]|uniref:Uncharacterized protein n=1 Tax=Aphanomyces astaci TaxID=112090 RepID=A0A6A5AN31_APHAT|nr:hypothetical protein AaE_004287 [Aphanomyces astaci]
MEKAWSRKEKARVQKHLQTLCKNGPVDDLTALLSSLSEDKVTTLLQAPSGGSDHLSCLHLAAAANQPSVVEYLLTKHAFLFPDVRKDYARTPLHEASLHGHAAVVAVLLRHDALSETGLTALYEAAKHGRVGAIDILLAHPHVDINLGSHTKHTPLHIAIGEGHLDAAERLIQGGADTTVQDGMGVTLWHEAAGVEGVAAMDLLVHYHIPLHDDHVDVVLARHPFHYAAVEGHAAFCAALLAANMVDVNLQDVDGCTGLYYASANGHANVLKVLLDANADVNLASVRRTPLHCAVMWERSECVRLLLAHGASTTALDKDNRTAEEMAQAFPDVAALFRPTQP